ncbi:alpha/beta fold hydrolase [Bacillus sp. FJAT-29814]|uniref:alpha/beta fold hydrolase n=1 Tax=Bacillus sp. FJAT-29814 TaxID=1729688 RepID=UPI00082A18FB|nr:alpha/beta hydrolase [Bacillus sp. FJAT-29814]
MKSFTEYQNINWTSRSVKLSTGVTYAYTECGPVDGTPILFLHGATDSRVSWSQVAPLMAEKGYHCFVPEYRGHGLSDKPETDENGYTVELHTQDVIAFMDGVGLQNAHVVGHSLGSLITQKLNVHIPERVLSSTLIATSPAVNVDNEVLAWILYGEGTEDGYPGLNNIPDDTAMPESFIQEWAGTTNDDSSFREATLTHAFQMPTHCWKSTFNGAGHFDNADGIKEMTGRVLVLWGTEDVLFPKPVQDQLKSLLEESSAKVTYVDFEGGSHNLHWDNMATATKVAQTINSFINK